MSIAPEKLREMADEGMPPGSVLRRANWLRRRSAALRQAADEIKRLQSDVTELMSACNEALNEADFRDGVAQDFSYQNRVKT